MSAAHAAPTTPPLILAGPHDALVLDPRAAVAVSDPGGPDALADAVDRALADHGGPAVAAGAVPFDHGRVGSDAQAPPARILVGRPRWTDRDGALPDVPGHAPVWRRVAGVGGLRHARRVARVLDALAGGAAEKVVLARRLDLAADGPAEVRALLHRLARRDPAATVFCVPLDDGGVFLGATPELLVARTGPQVTAHPLAGSLPRSTDPTEDAARARRLARSDKDLREHAYVVDDVVQTLRPWCTHVEVGEPTVVRTERVWHLGTPVTGRLRDPGTGATRLALALHPTPAVGGTPTGPAVALARAVEGRGRGYYAGAVGWQDASGDGRWYVAIRSAHLAPDARRLTLHAGGGIVAGSDPATEVTETDAKLRTVLDALEVRS
ncbi:isochorismate synthase [Cellulomonas phragmiteti]|uniref:isochorismate synthase n=1 Tax=Cellulomonas phragmiteti TaxID=478780 RepID=A0ABQ4DNT2_9CELL|nr:isochorismate synthase [Cellulomonas phragmiteti]GIG40581.1 putative isochorismate synthase MenF [Cellulomonas phragmiteti]